jgi:hypothetical protein
MRAECIIPSICQFLFCMLLYPVAVAFFYEEARRNTPRYLEQWRG